MPRAVCKLFTSADKDSNDQVLGVEGCFREAEKFATELGPPTVISISHCWCSEALPVTAQTLMQHVKQQNSVRRTLEIGVWYWQYGI